MRASAVVVTCALFVCGFPIAFSAGNTIPTIPQNQAYQETLASPRLAALQKELEAGNRAALENFWQEVTKQGAPLVEPVKGESRYVLLTFLWRAKEETKNVVVWSDLGNWRNLATLQMTRLTDTDLWYKTYRVRRASGICKHDRRPESYAQYRRVEGRKFIADCLKDCLPAHRFYRPLNS